MRDLLVRIILKTEEMRKAQQKYFSMMHRCSPVTRSGLLGDAKKLERQVDILLEEYRNKVNGEQSELFNQSQT